MSLYKFEYASCATYKKIETANETFICRFYLLKNLLIFYFTGIGSLLGYHINYIFS